MNAGVIIQARMGSQRFPGKVLKPVLGKPLLAYLAQRVRSCKNVSKIVIATSRLSGDDAIEAFCRNSGVDCYRGSEEDVLDRYYQCAALHGMEKIVRITGDCPLIDPELLSGVIQFYAENPEYDLVKTGPTYPEGFDAEILSMKNLEIAWQEAKLKSQREHVTTFLWENDQRFKIKWLSLKKDCSFLRLTVDEPLDFEVVQSVIERLYPKTDGNFDLKDILALYQGEPALFKKNANIIRNEGYFKSLEKD